MRENNKSRYEYNDLQDNYETLCKKKAIYVPDSTTIGNQGKSTSQVGRPQTAGSQRFNRDLSSAKSFGQFDFKGTHEDTSTFDNKKLQSPDVFFATSEDKRPTSSDMRKRPSSSKSQGLLKSLRTPDTSILKKQNLYKEQFETPQESMPTEQKSELKKSFVSLGKKPKDSTLYGFNLKTGKKVRKNEKKAFLIKKFVAPEISIPNTKETL